MLQFNPFLFPSALLKGCLFISNIIVDGQKHFARLVENINYNIDLGLTSYWRRKNELGGKSMKAWV